MRRVLEIPCGSDRRVCRPSVVRSQGKANLVLRREAPVSVYGVLQVHTAPPALCPHIEWAVAGTVGTAVSMPWVSQPAAPGSLRAELTWKGRPGTAGAITSALAALVLFMRRRGILGNTTGVDSGATAQYDEDTGQPVRSK